MDTISVLKKVETYLSEHIAEQVEANNLIYTEAPLSTQITFFNGLYDPLNLSDYPAIILAPDKVTADYTFPSYQIDVVFVFKSDDIQELNNKGIRYADCVVNSIHAENRIDDKIHLNQIEEVEYIQSSNIFIADVLIRVETTN